MAKKSLSINVFVSVVKNDKNRIELEIPFSSC